MANIIEAEENFRRFATGFEPMIRDIMVKNREEVEKVGWFSIDEIKKMNDEGEFFRNHYEEFEVLMDWLKKSE